MAPRKSQKFQNTRCSNATRQLDDFDKYQGSPMPAGLRGLAEAPILQATNVDEKLLEEFDVNDTNSLVTQKLSTDNYYYFPHQGPISNAPIEFFIKTAPDEYIKPSHTTLILACKITQADGKDIPEDAAVAPVDNTLHSLFQEIDFYMNGTKISQPHKNYGFVSILSQVTNFSRDAIEKLKEGEGMYVDPAGKLSNADATNTGWEQRRIKHAKSIEVEYEGRLFLPLFEQEKDIPGGIPIQIRLMPSPSEFVIHDGSPEAKRQNWKMVITWAKIRCEVNKVSPSLLEAHLKFKEKNPFRFLYTEIWPKHHILPARSSKFTINDSFTGVVPDRITIVFIDNEAFSGTYTSNPFHFQHKNCESIQIQVNGTMIPSKEIRTNFSSNPQEVTQAYNEMLRQTGFAFSNDCMAIGKKEWANGYTFYSFNTVPVPDSPDAKAPSRTGQVFIYVNFRQELSAPLVMLAFGETRGKLLTIDKNSVCIAQ